MTVAELLSVLNKIPPHMQVRIDTLGNDERQAHVVERIDEQGVVVIGVVNCGYHGVDVVFDETEERAA